MHRARILLRHLTRSGAVHVELEPVQVGAKVTIGDVTIEQPDDVDRPDLVPWGYEEAEHSSQEMLAALRWMIQKHSLKQDLYLLGPPGSARRRLGLRFCEVLSREAEYLAITRDTTEADLKQRAEVVGGTIQYVDGSPVRCALQGRVLVVEGIEKAERNVLPTLNNLLENREMALEDGRFLVHPDRYDELLKKHSTEELEQRKLVRVHEDFRVLALGLPVPRFPGYPLDPPLRSRFQARAVNPVTLGSKLDAIAGQAPQVPEQLVIRLLSVRETLRLIENEAAKFSNKIPHFPEAAVDHIVRVLALVQADVASELLNPKLVFRVYPFALICDEAQVRSVWETLSRFGFQVPAAALEDHTKQKQPVGSSSYDAKPASAHHAAPAAAAGSSASWEPSVMTCGELHLPDATLAVQDITALGPLPSGGRQLEVTLTRVSSPGREPVKLSVVGGDGPLGGALPDFVETEFHRRMLAPLLLDHAAGRDCCVIGPKGAGKSAFVRYLASQLGYDNSRLHTVHMFGDMTSRDLLQRRTTDSKGDTVWQTTPLVAAALKGDLAVLDGVDRLPPAALAVLRTLIEDRELTLFDGTRLVHHERYAKLLETHTEEQLRKLRVQPIPASFRMIAVALPPSKERNSARVDWMVEETASLFSFHYLPEMDNDTRVQILHSMFPTVSPKGLHRVLTFSEELATTQDKSAATSLRLSLRQLIRLCRRFSRYPEDLGPTLRRTLLAPFLPTTLREAVDKLCDKATGPAGASASQTQQQLRQQRIEEKDGMLCVGDASFPINTAVKNPELIPNVLFYDIPNQIEIMRDLLKDLSVGEKHLLLIGNQGVGKNKLADRLLQLLKLEREYMQLHRDTTVQALTLSPTLKNGVVVYEDSALVKAVQHGRVLVIDEADKAPLEVVSILKGLVEDGEMTLSDGRAVLRKRPGQDEASAPAGTVWMHPNFRLVVLANRPGFPFLGNDFFRESGDVLSVHVVDNPDPESEKALLKAYGPDVGDEIIDALVASFASLRKLVEEGTFSYPYSSRELVNIVRHMQKYPADGLVTALENVLSFDVFDPELMRNLQSAFQQHGIPLSLQAGGAAGNNIGPPRARVSLAPDEPLLAGAAPSLHLDQPPSGSRSTVTPNVTRTSEAGKTWKVPAGTDKPVLHWNQGRLQRFTEEMCSWALPLVNNGQVLGACALPDESVHVLVSSPPSLMSHFPSKKGLYDFHRARVLELTDFLPFLGPAQTARLQVTAVGLHTLVVFAPTHGVMLRLRVPAEHDTAESTLVTVIPLPLGNARMRQSFLQYISPGFKVPRWHNNAPTVNISDNAAAQLLECASLAVQSKVVIHTPGADSFLVVDLSKATSGVEMVQLPFGMQRLVVLNNTHWLAYSASGEAYRSTGADSGYEFHLIQTKAGVDAGDAPATHISGWLHEPKQQKQQKQKQEQQSGGAAQPSRPRGPVIPANLSQDDSLDTFPPQQEGEVVEVGGGGLSQSPVAGETSKEEQEQEQQPTLVPLSPSAVLVPEAGAHGAALRLLQGGALDGTSASTLTDVSIAHSRTAGEPVALQRKLTCALRDPMGQYVVPSFFKSAAGAETAHLTVFSPTLGSVRHVHVPEDAPKQSDLSLDMLNLQHSSRFGRIPRGSLDDQQTQATRSPFAALCALPSGDLVTAQSDGTMRVWQLDPTLLRDSAKVWRRLFGIMREAPLRLELESDKNKEVGSPKHGKQDPTGEQHVGGNTWAGGSGGSDTAGLGGKGGPYRLDGGHDVHQVPQEQKDAVSDAVKKEAREIAEAELKKRLAEIEMGDDENNMYEQYLGRVQKQITQLRLILEQAEAKNHEREWLRNQNQGDLDDNKLVDALTGEKLVYRRRGVATQQLGTPQRLPKRLHFVLDLSGSMYRFNGSDQRLERLMETALLMMEALEGFEHKYSYAMVGHSGDGPVVPLVEYGQPPKSRKERLKVLQRMFAHAQYCMSGDFTLEAVQHGVEDVTKSEADDYFVIAVSDANLARYGIQPESLADALMTDTRVNAYCIFLASLRDEISEIMPKMPAGHAFHCQDTSSLPGMFKTIFTSSRMMS